MLCSQQNWQCHKIDHKKISAYPGLCPLTNCKGRYMHLRSDNPICSQCDNSKNKLHMQQNHKILAYLEERDGKACDKLSARSIWPQTGELCHKRPAFYP
jgi:hypothetical protein